jgi:hypothetical protein
LRLDLPNHATNRVRNYPQRLWRSIRGLIPRQGFYFDRPLVLLQSDDWGRVGLRDQAGFEQLRAAGVSLGERPYDLYSFETADDVDALAAVLQKHRDSTGRSPSLEMNFILANLDFGKMEADDYRRIQLCPLADGLPAGWKRPDLFAAYRVGISSGILHPALHGWTHFCSSAVERHLSGDEDRASLLRTYWQAGTPYIHWRMPWIGYEYWDPEKAQDERFLSAETQKQLIGQAVGAFAKVFSALPKSACAPGYRADANTHRAWAQHGVRVAQGGPGMLAPPYFDRFGLLQLSRTVEFEPAVDPSFSVENCVRCAETSFERGIPAVVSVHSINFHSSVRDFRTPTLRHLDVFLSALESKHANLLYLRDDDLLALIETGSYKSRNGDIRLSVVRRRFSMSKVARQGGA